MPFYEILHTHPLSHKQQDQIAEAFTKIHAEKFGAPSLFVNVHFRHTQENGEGHYVGGKRKQTNSLRAFVRTGPSRTQTSYNELTSSLQTAWDEIIKPRHPSEHLSRIFVIGSIVAGREQGFDIPAAGQDGEWIQANWAEFEKRAEKGDEDFEGLLEECERRGLGK